MTLPPSRGKLIAILPEEIGRVEIATPPRCERGKVFPIGVRVLGASGKAYTGALPVRIEIIDPLGRQDGLSRYAAPVGASWTLDFRPALNDPPGTWTVRVTDLLGGTRAEQPFQLP